MDDPEGCIQFEVQLKALLAKLGGEGKAQLEEELKYISPNKRGSGSGDSGDDGPGRERRSKSRGRKSKKSRERGKGKSAENTKRDRSSKQDMKKHKFVFNYNLLFTTSNLYRMSMCPLI